MSELERLILAISEYNGRVLIETPGTHQKRQGLWRLLVSTRETGDSWHVHEADQLEEAVDAATGALRHREAERRGQANRVLTALDG